MPDHLDLRDSTLADVGTELISAAEGVSELTAAPPVDLSALTVVGADLSAFIDDLVTGCAALADAAMTGAITAADLVERTLELDARVAAAVLGGFALPES